MRAALPALLAPGGPLVRLLCSRNFATGTKKPSLSPLATELLLARRRESHARESRSAEWREALGEVRRACGVDDEDNASSPSSSSWQAAAAALQRAALASSSAADRLLGDDREAASDAAELHALLTLMAGGGPKKPAAAAAAARRRATAALVPALAAAPSVVLSDTGTRNAAQVLASLRKRAELSPAQTLEAVERCPSLLGFSAERVNDNLLFLLGASAASMAAAGPPRPKNDQPPLLSALALGAPGALGRPTADLRATWEFLVGGGPAFAPERDLRAWPEGLERGPFELRVRWALARRLGVRLLRPSSEEAGKDSKPSTWPARAWAEATPDAIDRALGLEVGGARRGLAAAAEELESGDGGGGGERRW